MGPSRGPAPLRLHLLGRPHLEGGSGQHYRFRSRKSWALLACLVLAERPPSRRHLGALLYDDADDPGRALRWNLAEIRRALGQDGSVGGDPVVLRLGPGATVDVDVLTRGDWREAVRLPGLGQEVLDGLALRGALAFETWLLSQQRYLAAASEAILHEAALGSLSAGALDDAVGYAVRATAMNPLDENHQALLIRLYRLSGDDEGAERQFAACVALFARDLGTAPGPSVESALSQTRGVGAEAADDVTIAASIEAGSAAVAAGALHAGVHALTDAVRLADRSDATAYRVAARLALAEALVHRLGGLDEEGLATLYTAADIAERAGRDGDLAEARAELGYVDFLRARYDRAEHWLTSAAALAPAAPALLAKTSTYLGAVASDRASYPRARRLLHAAVGFAQQAGDLRREAFAMSMLGRVSLFCDDLATAADQLDASVQLAARDHWLGFLPWPQALWGEVLLRTGDVAGARALLQQAFARACQLGDPCWEGTAARGLALVAAAEGDPGRAFDLLADARARCNRLADPYVWLDAAILDAQCELGSRHGHPDTAGWVETLRDLASRTGMKDLLRRSIEHGAALGLPADAAAVALFACDVDAGIRATTAAP